MFSSASRPTLPHGLMNSCLTVGRSFKWPPAYLQKKILPPDKGTLDSSDGYVYITKLKRNGVSIKSIQEPWLDTRQEGIGELLLSVFAWVASQERVRIRERTMAGLERARIAGKTLGRPAGSKDKKQRRKSGYFMRYLKDK